MRLELLHIYFEYVFLNLAKNSKTGVVVDLNDGIWCHKSTGPCGQSASCLFTDKAEPEVSCLAAEFRRVIFRRRERTLRNEGGKARTSK